MKFILIISGIALFAMPIRANDWYYNEALPTAQGGWKKIGPFPTEAEAAAYRKRDPMKTSPVYSVGAPVKASVPTISMPGLNLSNTSDSTEFTVVTPNSTLVANQVAIPAVAPSWLTITNPGFFSNKDYMAQMLKFGQKKNRKGPLVTLKWDNDGSEEHKRWAEALRKWIKNYLNELNQAEDLDTMFGVNFKDLPDDEQIDIWASLFVAVADKESFYKGLHFNVNAEDPTDPGGGSHGLFQISYHNLTSDYYQKPYGKDLIGNANDPALNLYQPLINIQDAVVIFSTLIVKTHYIVGKPHGPTNVQDSYEKPFVGANSYWSTLRSYKLNGTEGTLTDMKSQWSTN